MTWEIAIPAVIALVGTAASVASQRAQATTAAKSAQVEQRAEIQNAVSQEQNAAAVVDQTGAAEALSRRRSRSQLSEQRTGVLDAGYSLTGSALDLYEEAAIAGEMDALSIRYEGDLQARGLVQDANQRRQRASDIRAPSRSTLTAGLLGAAAGGVSSYAAAGGKWPSLSTS